jgi:hypothetical protein
METLVEIFVISTALYLIPTWVALWRGHRQRLAIFALNLCGGWTAIGWVGALVWACLA